MRYEHIIWDFDGTLFDTYPVMAQAFWQALKEDGIDERINEISANMRISMGHAIRYYSGKYRLGEEFSKRYAHISNTSQRERVVPMEHAAQLCRAIHNEGSKNYLYTHRGESSVYFLEKYGMAECFAELVTSNNKFPRKPNPEGILYLIKKHDIIRDRAIMIGDRPLDVDAGNNAGIHACFYGADGEVYETAEYNISSLGQLYDVLGIDKARGDN